MVTEKPEDYTFKPGQASDVAMDKEGWKEEKRPFTFTSLPTDDDLEFTIKVYPLHNGVTKELAVLKAGDGLLLGDVYGAIQYEGTGVFIAGGAGITPFLSILKSLKEKDQLQGNKLLFANKETGDIILKDKLQAMLGDDFSNILSSKKTEQYSYGHIDKDYLQKEVSDFTQKFYVCGPPKMMEQVEKDLKDLGVKDNQIIKEDFS
jgi:ferredoxin-NADP reductase